MPRDQSSAELRAVAPIVVAADRRLVGTVTLVASGDQVIGVTSAELLRPLQATSLAVVTKLDGSAATPVSAWFMGRYTGVALVELATELPTGHDVVPLAIGAIHASVDVHGAPAALVAIAAAAAGAGFTRRLIPVHVDRDDGGGMSDQIAYLASPIDPADAELAVEGCAAFAWLPAEPALGRASEVVAFAVAYPYRAQIARPRETPVIAELIGLEDLGRALLATSEPEPPAELTSVSGEIEDRPAPSDSADPLAGLDE